MVESKVLKTERGDGHTADRSAKVGQPGKTGSYLRDGLGGHCKTQQNRMELGDKAKDKITGFEGLLTGYSSFLTGCDQYFVQPKMKPDGAFIEGKWFDEGRLEVTEVKVVGLADVAGEKPGCDIQAPVK